MLTKNAQKVLRERYLGKDENGNVIETPEDMFRRVASSVAEAERNFDATDEEIEKLTERFYGVMTRGEFLPNSPTLMNAGRALGQLSACFVLPVGDSMEEIFETIKETALVQKSGGGTGFSFSRIRGNGAIVSTTGGTASGPISFMTAFNAATETVKQGSVRRGANMGLLRIDHPDILEFIDCKKDNDKLNNFNISVGLTEEFMEKVQRGEEYFLIDPHTKEVTGSLNAKEVFDKIVDAAWKNGEPGIIFLDRMNEFNVVPSMGEIECTNPCGEQPLLPHEACNLGSINMSAMVKRVENGIYEVDYEKLRETVHTAVRFLDDVIEINQYPLEIIDKTTKQARKIGLGIMGWADMLLRLELPYGSKDSLKLARKIMEFIRTEGRIESAKLAEVRGPFPKFEESIYKDGIPLRNGTITTIAPTGTLAVIAGCSSGVEPVFAYVFIRNVMETEMLEINPILEEKLKEKGIYTEDIMREIAKKGSLQNIDGIPEDIKSTFVSAHDITPEAHIRMQAAFQEFTDNAVSKTVNFPKSATREDVAKAYMLAYKTGCKGTTVYRNGSREEQVLNIGSVNKKEREEVPKSTKLLRERPKVVTGITEKMRIGCGNLYITVNADSEGLCEIFTNNGKGGGCACQSDATSRVVSVALRNGVDPKIIIDQLRGIRCPSTVRQSGMDCTSCPDAIAKVMAKEFEKELALNEEMVSLLENNDTEENVVYDELMLSECPECHQRTLTSQDGCKICLNCSFSHCNG